jgi:hypothetical protein
VINYTRLAGSTDVSVVVHIFDPATALPDTGVVFNTSGLALEYRREGAASTAIAEVTLAALTTAHADGGFIHIGNGDYRLDLPDAAVGAGAAGVLIHGALTSRIVIGCYVHLVAYNPQDAVRLGLTALPNVASGSAGAIPTTGTGANQISVTSGTVLLSSATETQIDDILVDTAALDSRLTAGRATNLDTLAFLPSATAGSTGGLATYDNVFSGMTFGSVADASPAADGFDGNAGLDSSNDHYNGAFLLFLSGANTGIARPRSDYIGASRSFVFSAGRPFPNAPANGDVFSILGDSGA